MFEGLDDIQWAQMRHAYGSAADVPGLIRDLMSSDANTRKEAIGNLSYNLWHQGTIFEPTSYAVPFLIAILESPDAQDKDEILHYLARLAQGASFIDVHQAVDWAYSAEQRASDEFKEQLSREVDWVRKTYDAVLKHYAVYIKQLEGTPAQVKKEAIDLMILFPEKRAETVSRLYRMLKTETDIAVQVTLAQALGQVLTSSDQEALKALEAYCAPDYALIVRLTAAQALAHVLKDQTPTSVLAVLRLGLLNPPIDRPSRIITQWEYALPVEVGHALYDVGRKLGDPLVPLLCDYLKDKNASSMDIYDAVETLLVIVFNNQPAPEGTLAQQLDPLQHQVLTCVADYALGSIEPNLQKNVDALFDFFRLPKTPDTLRAFLQPGDSGK